MGKKELDCFSHTFLYFDTVVLCYCEVWTVVKILGQHFSFKVYTPGFFEI